MTSIINHFPPVVSTPVSAHPLLLPLLVGYCVVAQCHHRLLLSWHAAVQQSMLLLPAIFSAIHWLLPLGSLVTSHRPPLLPQLPALVDCCVVVRHPLLSLHAVLQPLTLALPATFATNPGLLSSGGLLSSHHQPLPLSTLVDCCFLH